MYHLLLATLHQFQFLENFGRMTMKLLMLSEKQAEYRKNPFPMKYTCISPATTE